MTQPARLAISAALLIATLLVLQFRGTGEAIPIRKPLDTFPSAVGDWHGREATILEVDVLNVLKVKDYLMRRYVDPAGRSLWLYIGYWDTQRKGAQVHSPRNCLPGAGWEPLEASKLTIPIGSPPGPTIIVNQYLIQKERARQVVLYWYHSQGRATAGEVEARIELVKSAIRRNRTDGALVRVSSPVSGSVQETAEGLVKYVQAIYPVLSQYLPD